jgi:hypothetical protein
MIAYEFYCRNKENGYNLIGILPERRKRPERINEESVINWLRTVLGKDENTDLDHPFYIKIEI